MKALILCLMFVVLSDVPWPTCENPLKPRPPNCPGVVVGR